MANRVRVATVWDARHHCEASGHLLSTRKQKGVVEAALKADLIRAVSNPGFDPDTVWADIARIHDPAYVAAVRTGKPRGLAEPQGFHWSPEFAESLARIWDGHQVVARLALTERVVLHPVSGAHHAQYDHGSGFCTFNFLVGAGTALLEEGDVRRVAIIDLDAHIGDGTLALVRGDRRFGLFDIASSSWASGKLDPARHLFGAVQDADEYLENAEGATGVPRPGQARAGPVSGRDGLLRGRLDGERQGPDCAPGRRSTRDSPVSSGVRVVAVGSE